MYDEHEVENDQKHTRGCRKNELLLFWILHNIMEIIGLWTNVRQCNITFSVVHVHICFKHFHLFIYFFYCMPGFRLISIKGIYASG